MNEPRVALVTYSTKPRGGVVHTLALAEALVGLGRDPMVIALGDIEADDGFYRPTIAPHMLVQAPPPAPTLEERVFSAVDALAEGLAELAGEFDILHAQDCISARAAIQARRLAGATGATGADVAVLRTVHHVDDFTTSALIDCQRQAILEPDRVLVVSEHWRHLLAEEYAVDATVVYNGVDPSRFGPIPADVRAALRERIGATGRFVFLAVGGIEPRKGSVHLLEALGLLKRRLGLASAASAVLVVVGGHSFQDYTAYRDDALARLPDWDLRLGEDVVMPGTVSDAELAAWYRSADALVFPSLKEGWGLVVLEAMSADLPVVATDIPVFREYLTHGRDSLLVPAENAARLAGAMEELMVDPDLGPRLCHRAHEVVQRFTWPASARQHLAIYDQLFATEPRELVNPTGRTPQ